jgi:DNA transformation protein and related proteins
MSTDALVAHCLELMAPLAPVRARRMFGGHGLYLDDVFVALIADDRLYLKVDAQSEALFAAAGCEPFVYDGQGRVITMGYRSAPPDAMESPALMAPWARLAMAAALRARAAKAVRPLKQRKAPPAPSATRDAPRAASGARKRRAGAG